MRSLLTLLLLAAPAAAADRPPNVVVITADDLGSADLGCTGATGWTTPHLDKLAADGVRFGSFYTAQPVCSASRAALLTGCYPNRLGIHGALMPTARHGLADTERTLAEVLKAKGYATACVGKWHLGHHPRFLPTRHGFDEYLGLPYSNDMWPRQPKSKYPPLPLLDGDRVQDPDVSADTQATLTRRYTDRATDFIARQKDRPFFLYLAHTFPHVPLFAGERFRGTSGAGLYGDVVQELDWSAGEVLAALDRHGLRDNTLVVFTSDNGPWLSYGDHAGTAGRLREGKGTVFEGGVRVPFLARWPGRIPAGTVQDQPAMSIDLLPTVAKLAGGDLPAHGVDGRDVWPLFAGVPGAKSPHPAYFFYFKVNELQAVRAGRWKLVLPHTSANLREDRPGGTGGRPAGYRPGKVPQALFDLVADPGERADVAAGNPAVVAELLAHAERARADLGDSLTNRPGSGRREPGRLPEEKP